MGWRRPKLKGKEKEMVSWVQEPHGKLPSATLYGILAVSMREVADAREIGWRAQRNQLSQATLVVDQNEMLVVRVRRGSDGKNKIEREYGWQWPG